MLVYPKQAPPQSLHYYPFSFPRVSPHRILNRVPKTTFFHAPSTTYLVP